MAETDLRHISPEVRGRLQTARCLGYDPSPKKEGMPSHLLMAYGPPDLGYDPSPERRGCHVAC